MLQEEKAEVGRARETLTRARHRRKSAVRNPQTLCKDETATSLLSKEAGQSTSIPGERGGPPCPYISAFRGPVTFGLGSGQNGREVVSNHFLPLSPSKPVCPQAASSSGCSAPSWPARVTHCPGLPRSEQFPGMPVFEY